MELTRRDGLAALAGIGLLDVGLDALRGVPHDGDVSRRDRAVLLAATDVLYPSAVSVDAAFVETYAGGKYANRPADRRRREGAIDGLDRIARDRYGTGFSALAVDRRERVLQAVGAHRVASVPDGRLPERIRYYVVNDLLYALYATPVGGRLLGNENPTGYPGGLEAYQGGSDP